jgi:hypothetical protein
MSSLLVWTLLAAGGAPAAITPGQIEADWLRQEAVRGRPAAAGPAVAPEQDARGGCDGVKTGRWGFHTQMEPNPWWQVDLGVCTPIGRLVIYNRCDGTASRNAHIMILLSDDGQAFRTVYRHNGRTFYGYTDHQPLSVPLAGAAARYVRLQLPGTSYFHLDEVEVYAAGAGRNVALGRPATQSSTSPWSVAHETSPGAVEAEAVRRVIRRGRKLAADLRRRGVAVDDEVRRLEEINRRLQEKATVPARAEGPCGGPLPAVSVHGDCPNFRGEEGVGLERAAIAAKVGLSPSSLPAEGTDPRRWLYLQACWAVRRMALGNPLLDFEAILFVKAAPTRFPHMSDQFYGWWSRPGGGLFVLEGFRGPRPRLRCLTADMPVGSFLRPDLSHDGKKVLFAYCKYYPHVADLPDKADKAHLPEDAFYHVYEMDLEGGRRRRLTHGRYDDFDARYLPGGRIVFLSTRKGQFLQTSAANTAATASADLPDSYVRCGGDNYRPVPVFTLHVMEGAGGNLRPLSAFENFEWTPEVAGDGRILYTRWDYIDRFNGHFFSLWSTNPDGTSPQLVYKNYTVRPQVACEARPVPGSAKLVFTACAHHSILGGSLVLFDRTRGTEGPDPIVRLTPEVPFPETEANADSYYANPYPLAEEHYLVGWADHCLPPHGRFEDAGQNPVNGMGLYLFDAFGNLNLLYRDAEISSGCPIPIRPRPQPPLRAETAAAGAAGEGTFLVQDVYRGLPGVARGTVRSLRVVAVPPKVQPQMNQPRLGISAEDPGKYVLGTVPVEADGSACFRVPSGVPLFFQALDADGLALQTMRSLTYAAAGQTASCIGCHESRDISPAAAGRFPRAARAAPARLAPGPQGTWPLSYDRLVQPVLDRCCVSCHRPGGDKEAARLDLTAGHSYENLLSFGGKDLWNLAQERDRSLVGDCPARRSKLWHIFANGQRHHGLLLDRDGLDRLATWMDLYAQRQGHFSARQEEQLRQFRQKLAPLLAE